MFCVAMMEPEPSVKYYVFGQFPDISPNWLQRRAGGSRCTALHRIVIKIWKLRSSQAGCGSAQDWEQAGQRW